jgi:hypothetical protein
MDYSLHLRSILIHVNSPGYLTFRNIRNEWFSKIDCFIQSRHSRIRDGSGTTRNIRTGGHSERTFCSSTASVPEFVPEKTIAPGDFSSFIGATHRKHRQ